MVWITFESSVDNHDDHFGDLNIDMIRMSWLPSSSDQVPPTNVFKVHKVVREL